MKRKIQEMVLVLQMAVRCCVSDAVIYVFLRKDVQAQISNQSNPPALVKSGANSSSQTDMI